MHPHHIGVGFASTVLSLLVSSHRAYGQCQYEFIPYYSASPSDTSITLWSISETGWLGGWLNTLYGNPIVITPDGTLVQLPGGQFGHGRVHGVTNDGIAVGVAQLDPGSTYAKPVRWIDGVLIPLPSPEPFLTGNVYDTNNSGTVVGSLYGWPSLNGVAIWQDGVLTHFLTDEISCLEAIADDGTAVGRGKPQPDSLLRALVWRDGVVEWLALPEGMTSSFAGSVSQSGLVAGHVQASLSAAPQATVWTDGLPLLLPMQPGYTRSNANGINSLGQIVGRCQPPGLGPLSDLTMLWQHGVGYPLFSLLVSPFAGTILSAADINERGEIAGYGRDANGIYCGMVLRPVRTRAGDVTIDCRVDALDISALLEFWGKQYGYDGGPGDLDGDREVGPLDLAVLLGDWAP